MQKSEQRKRGSSFNEKTDGRISLKIARETSLVVKVRLVKYLRAHTNITRDTRVKLWKIHICRNICANPWTFQNWIFSKSKIQMAVLFHFWWQISAFLSHRRAALWICCSMTAHVLCILFLFMPLLEESKPFFKYSVWFLVFKKNFHAPERSSLLTA